VVAAALRAAVQGNWQGVATGDATLLGGTFVISPDGLVQVAYYDQHAGDHPDLGRLIARARRRLARA